nr:reverse transcriptase domain-containing protein [Tanacetum cinerariifolium]
MSMTIQSSVKDKILATLIDTSKVDNAPSEMLRDLDQQVGKRADDVFKEWNSGDDQTQSEMDDLPRGLADVVESVRDAIRFESHVLWAEIRESSLTGLELVQETTDKVVLVKDKPKAARDHQKSYVDNRCKSLEFEVKEYLKKDKIGSKTDKNGKRSEARKSQKQLQWIEEEKLKKTQKERPEMQTHAKSIQVLKEERKEDGKDTHIGYNCPSKFPQIEEERAATAKYWKLPVCYDDEDDEERSDSLDDNIISGLPLFSAIIPDEPVLSTEEPDKSLSMGNEHLDTISATESDEFIKSSVENFISIPNQIEDFSESNKKFSSIDDDSFSIDNIDYVEASPLDSELVSSEVMEIVIPEVGGIDDDILLTIKDDILHEKLLNVNLLISKIEALNVNPTPSFDCKTKSSSTSLNSLLEETNTFDKSLPEFETFCFDVEEISSGSITTHPDISLLEYEAFYDDHVKEISSGSPTTHSDSSLYASFIFDLSINPFPPADRSDSYEFIDELIPFISPPEYDCFLFKVEPNSRDFTKDVVEDISPTKEPQVLNTLPTHPTLQLNMKF